MGLQGPPAEGEGGSEEGSARYAELALPDLAYDGKGSTHAADPSFNAVVFCLIYVFCFIFVDSVMLGPFGGPR